MADKKGLTLTVIYIAIIIIGFIVVLGVVGQFLTRASDAQAELVCHNSVVARGATALRIGESFDFKAFPLLCKTIDKKIAGDDKEVVKKQVGDLIARCWYMFGEGRYAELGKTTRLMPETKNDCFTCYRGSIEDLEEKITGEEIFEYLRKENYRNTTYLDYVQSAGGPGVIAVATDIDPKGIYAVTFGSKNKDRSHFFTWVGAGAAVGGIVLIKIGGVISATGIGLPIGGAVAGAGAIAFLGGTAVAVQQAAVNVGNLFTEREVSTVYLTNLKDIEGKCNVEASIAGK